MGTLVLIWIMCQLLAVGAGDLKKELDVMKKGADAGNAIADALTSPAFSQSLQTIGKQIAPFLGAIGPVISLITIFLPTSPSPELRFMQKKFAEMDTKFDRVFQQFGDLKNFIKETSLKQMYGTYEHRIKGLSHRLNQMLKASKTSVKGQRQLFIDAYKSTYQNSANRLLEDMMGNNKVFGYNIPKEVMSYTKNDRKRVQRILMGVFQLITQGVKVHLAYLQAAGLKGAYKDDSILWEKQLKKLLSHIKNKDYDVSRKYHQQSGEDVRYLGVHHDKESHAQFAKRVYEFLNRKYYWRYWNVVVYNPLHGGHLHWVKTCGGHIIFRQQNRNVLVASVSKSKRPINVPKITQMLRGVSVTKSHWWHGTQTRSAEDVYKNHLPSEVRNGCTCAGAGVIKINAKMAWMAPPNRFVVVKRRHRYYLYAFG